MEPAQIPPIRHGPSSASASLIGAVVLMLVAAIAPPLAAQGRQLLFVENTHDGTVSVIDDSALSVIGSISVGLSPDDIVPAPAGDVLYLSRFVRDEQGRPAGHGEVVAIDPVALQVLWRVPVPGFPNHVAVSPDGRWVYVTIVSGSWVDVIDTRRRSRADSIEVGLGPHDIALSPDGRRGYVGLIRGTEVTVVDAATRHVLRKIPFGEHVRPLAVTRDGERMFVQLSRLHGFVVANPRTGSVLRTVRLPVPEGSQLPDSTPITANHGIRITTDGRFLIANGSLLDFVAIYSFPDLKLVATVPVGRDPNWVTLSPDGRHVYVSNRGSDDVSVIDTRGWKEIARIQVGHYPQRMAAVSLRERP